VKELKIIQADDGKISIETTGPEGEPVITEAASIDEAIDLIKGEIGGGEEVIEGESEEIEEIQPIEPDEGGVVSASKGKKLEDGLPVVDKKKLGTRPKMKADWSDYSAM